MSVYTKNGKRILHVHVPRTGGRSIRGMLIKSGWEKEPVGKKTRNLAVTYQHQICIDWQTWGAFDFIFAIIRNPYDRLESAARRPGVISDNFFGWLEKMKNSHLFDKCHWPSRDNHLTPQHFFINNEVRVIKFEDGFESIVKELKQEDVIDKHQRIMHTRGENQATLKSSYIDRPPAWEENIKITKFINEIYAKDFELGNYTMRKTQKG